MRCRKKNKGFSLIELIIVSVMVAMISLAVYATFNNGLRIWQRINEELPTEELGIFFERFSSDVRSLLPLYAVAFVGEKEMLEFSALLHSPLFLAKTPALIRYRFIPSGKSLERSESDWSMLSNKEEPKSTHVLKNISNAVFDYYMYDDIRKEYSWVEMWDGKSFPLAVRLRVETEYKNRQHMFQRTVSILLKE